MVPPLVKGNLLISLFLKIILINVYIYTCSDVTMLFLVSTPHENFEQSSTGFWRRKTANQLTSTCLLGYYSVQAVFCCECRQLFVRRESVICPYSFVACILISTSLALARAEFRRQRLDNAVRTYRLDLVSCQCCSI